MNGVHVPLPESRLATMHVAMLRQNDTHSQNLVHLVKLDPVGIQELKHGVLAPTIKLWHIGGVISKKSELDKRLSYCTFPTKCAVTRHTTLKSAHLEA
jgi:hypothetical protein